MIFLYILFHFIIIAKMTYNLTFAFEMKNAKIVMKNETKCSIILQTYLNPPQGMAAEWLNFD